MENWEQEVWEGHEFTRATSRGMWLWLQRLRLASRFAEGVGRIRRRCRMERTSAAEPPRLFRLYRTTEVVPFPSRSSALPGGLPSRALPKSICDGVLNRAAVRPGPFDCPHCLKQIRPIHRPIYRWARGGLCLALAIFAAKLKGFDWSFLIFVVSAYALPAFFFWDIFALDMFPPTRFEPTRSSVQILGIGKGRRDHGG